MLKWILKPLFTLGLLLLTTSLVAGQDAIDDACAQLIQVALSRFSACEDLSGAQACYVSGPLSYVPRDRDVTPAFSRAGDTIDAFDFLSLTSAGADVDARAYGVATVTLTDALINQPRMILLGDVLLRDAGPDAFTISTATQPILCEAGVNAVLIQTPAEVEYLFTVNGAQIRMFSDSLIVLTAQANDYMSIYTVTGAIDVTARSTSQRLTLGQFTRVSLGLAEGLVALSPPSVPARYDGDALQAIPLRLVIDDIVEVTSNTPWVATGIEVAAGDIFVLQATGFAQTGTDLPWSVAEGLTRLDCAAFGRLEWDCACRLAAGFGECTIDNLASMTLLGRVGDSLPFVAGAGGVFRAQSAGMLFLGANDNSFDDNVGSYHVLVQVIPAND